MRWLVNMKELSGFFSNNCNFVTIFPELAGIMEINTDLSENG